MSLGTSGRSQTLLRRSPEGAGYFRTFLVIVGVGCIELKFVPDMATAKPTPFLILPTVLPWRGIPSQRVQILYRSKPWKLWDQPPTTPPTARPMLRHLCLRRVLPVPWTVRSKWHMLRVVVGRATATALSEEVTRLKRKSGKLNSLNPETTENSNKRTFRRKRTPATSSTHLLIDPFEDHRRCIKTSENVRRPSNTVPKKCASVSQEGTGKRFHRTAPKPRAAQSAAQ